MDIKTRSALAVVVSGLFFAQAASAYDGTISIEGQITDVTCSIAVNGGTNDATVTLPTVSVSALQAAGSTAGSTSFQMTLSDCIGTTLSNAYAYFELGAMVDTTSGRLTSNGTAGNVQVQLLDKDLTPIIIGSSTQGGVKADVSEGGPATLDYAARYYATGASTSGSVQSYVNYSIVYD